MKRPQIRVTHTFATLEVSQRTFKEIERKLKAAKYDHSFVDANTIDMQGIGLVPAPKKQPVKGEMINGKELRAAAEKGLPVYYTEEYYSPSDRHMNFKGKCVMKKITTDEFYIGNSDIDVSLWQDDELVSSAFNEGEYAVYKVNGIQYL